MSTAEASNGSSEVFAAALALGSQDRGRLVSELLASLDREMPGVQKWSPEEWQSEIERRSDELHRDLDRGANVGMTAAESLADVRSRLNELKKS